MIRSKHNNLLNYFICDKRDLSPAYVRAVRSFLIQYAGQNIMAAQIQMEKSISYKPQAASAKLQAPSAKQRKFLTPTKSLI